MTETLAAQAVEMMAIDRLRPAEDNPRDSLGELGDLTDSIEAVGVWQPLTVIPTGEIGGAEDLEIHMVVSGHRRLAAAILAERTHVPVIVRTDVEEDLRQQVMFIENFHRLDLSVLERARSLKQLADAGVSQRDIGKKVGISQGTVSKWLALLKLPETAQKWVTEGKMPQEDAVALAALPAEGIEELTANGSIPSKYAIEHKKHDLERAKKIGASKKLAKEKGWKVLDEDPDYEPQLLLEGGSEPVALDEDRHDPQGLLAHVDPNEHETEPCHAVHVSDWSGEITRACTDPNRHPKPEGWKSPYELEAEAEQAEILAAVERGETPKGRRQEGRTVRGRAGEARPGPLRGAREALEPVVQVCRRLVADAVCPDAVMDFVTVTLMTDENSFEFSWARDLLDLPQGRNSWDSEAIVEAIRAEGEISGMSALLAWGLGLALATLEDLAIDMIAETDVEADFVRISQGLLEALAGEGAPTYEEFVASLSADTAEEGDADGPIVEIYEKSGKYRRRCSECGLLDGMNTKIELAEERKAQHLSEVHGVTDETVAA